MARHVRRPVARPAHARVAPVATVVRAAIAVRVVRAARRVDRVVARRVAAIVVRQAAVIAVAKLRHAQ